MLQFEVGKTYYMFSPCSQDCVWSFQVMKRTASTVTLLSDEGFSKSFRINRQVSEYREAETVFPLGKYSMAPCLSADRF